MKKEWVSLFIEISKDNPLQLTKKLCCLIYCTNSIKLNFRLGIITNFFTSSSECDTSLFSRYPEIPSVFKVVTYIPNSFNLSFVVACLKNIVFKLMLISIKALSFLPSTARKTILSFSRCFKKIVFPKKIAVEYNLPW